MQYKFIEYSTSKNTATLRLNRPDKLNAICFDMVKEINHAVSNINPEITVLFIEGNDKAFSAGGDLKEMQQLEQAEAEKRSRYIHETFRKLQQLNCPVVALISGFCFGGGLELTMHCDMRIADETAKFALPEVKYGIIPGAGGTVLLPEFIGQGKAAWYLMTGEQFDAHQAKNMGLVEKTGILQKEKQQLIDFFSQVNNESVGALKQQLNTRFTKTLDERYKDEAAKFAQLLFKNGRSGIDKNFKK